MPGATSLGSLALPALKDDAGTYLAIEGSGSGVSFDSLTIARCGGAAPSYETVVLDTFNRANSQDPGGPELPVGQTYSGDNADVQISAKTLTIVDHGYLTMDPGHFEHAGLRIRAAAKFGTLGWLTIGYNGGKNGFDLWRQDEQTFFIEYRSGGPAGTFDFPLKTTELYFIEFDIDQDFGVVTLRTTSYGGPIVTGVEVKDIVEAAPSETTMTIGNTWMAASLAYEEYSVERLQP